MHDPTIKSTSDLMESPKRKKSQFDVVDVSFNNSSFYTVETAESTEEASGFEREVTIREAVTTSQFWLIFAMSILSVFQGYYILNVYKAYGYTKPALKNDLYLTKVGSAAAFMGALRFVWSGSMDYITINPYKKVYGTLLVI